MAEFKEKRPAIEALVDDLAKEEKSGALSIKGQISSFYNALDGKFRLSCVVIAAAADSVTRFRRDRAPDWIQLFSNVILSGRPVHSGSLQFPPSIQLFCPALTMIPPPFSRPALAVCFWILGGLATTAFSAPIEPAESGEAQRELVVTDWYNVPIAELSGLAIARDVEATRGAADMDSIRLYAIGDATYDVASLIINSSSGHVSISLSNAAPVLGKHGGGRLAMGGHCDRQPGYHMHVA